MSSRIVRSSKYRHVYGDEKRQDKCYNGAKPDVGTGDSNFLAGNKKFIAYPQLGGGGPVVVWDRATTGRFPTALPVINVHKAKVLDLQFSPFIDNLIATASEDCHIGITLFPEDGLTENIGTANATLSGHNKKVGLLNFHPSANNILASSAGDFMVKVWDVEAQTDVFTYQHEDAVASLSWNEDGSLMATTCKDHKVRFYDPRKADESMITVDGHAGAKPSKATFLSDNMLAVFGFNNRASREYIVIDPRNADKPLLKGEVGGGTGVLTPYFDHDTSILFVSAKGDSSIKYFEWESNQLHYLTEFRGQKVHKGVTFLPKRACDVTSCEIDIALRLTKDSINPVHFIVPRKSDLFQEDIFPPSAIPKPAMEAADYLKGENKPLEKGSMKPGTEIASGGASFTAKKSRDELQSELDTANARIKELEAELAKLKA